MFENDTFLQNNEIFNGIFGDPCTPKNDPNLNVMLRTPVRYDQNPLCKSVQDHIYPRKGQNNRGKWKYIINTDKYRQGTSITKCRENVENEACKYNEEPGLYPNATACHQLYSRHDFLTFDSQNGKLEYDSFKVPTACICKILDPSIFEQ